MEANTMTAMPVAPVKTTHEELKGRIQLRQAQIGIIGLGYVGLPLALLLGYDGHAVTGFDIDAAKVEKLADGDSYIARIEPREIQDARRPRFFLRPRTIPALAEMDARHHMCADALGEFREPDLRYIINTAESIAPHHPAVGGYRVTQLITGWRKKSLDYAGAKQQGRFVRGTVTSADSKGVFYVAFAWGGRPDSTAISDRISRKWWEGLTMWLRIWPAPYTGPSSIGPYEYRHWQQRR